MSKNALTSNANLDLQLAMIQFINDLIKISKDKMTAKFINDYIKSLVILLGHFKVSLFYVRAMFESLFEK